MHCSPYLSQHQGPASYMPKTVFHHFLVTKCYTEDREYLVLYERGEFLNAIKSNEDFSKFWIHIQEQHPEKKEYFLSLTNEDQPFDSCWIESEYEEYRQHSASKAFEALSEEERRLLRDEFNSFRPAAYRAVLEGESKRLNCNIADVKPKSPVIPWGPDHEEESVLARLPDELFGRLLPLLESLDIFRMTLVCKRWKHLIHSNRGHFKRAEHAVTTHLIRFTDWLKPAKTIHVRTVWQQYQMLSWCLTKWYCGITENLETLILDHSIPYTNLANLLQSCPNLKHLRIGYNADFNVSPPETALARVKLRRLEVFVSAPLRSRRDSVKPCRQLHRDILAFSTSLRVFKGPLSSEDLFAIDVQNPVSNVFSKLIALDLETVTPTALEVLAYIDDLQLKYLRVGYHDYDTRVDRLDYEERTRNALHQLLPKLKKLEMLSTSKDIGVTNKTVQLITDLDLNINWAVLCHSYSRTGYDEEGFIISIERDPLQPEVLIDFRNMLLSKNPDIDLSDIRLVLREGKTFEALEATNIGFTIMKADKCGYSTKPFNELHDQNVKQRLGINY